MPNNLLVLVIEEKESDFNLIKTYIEEVEEYNATIVWQNSHEGGYEFFINEDIDICFLDGKLGGETSEEFLKKLKHHKEDIPIILIGNEKEEHLEQIFQDEGVDDFIYRTSLTPNLLRHSLRYGFENHRRLLKLRAQEEKYNKLFYNSIEAIFTADKTYKIIEANQSFKQLIGITSVDDFDFRTLFIENDFETLFDPNRTQTKRRIHRTKIKNKAGFKLDVYISISPIFSDDNGTYYQGIIHDITDLEKAQSKIVETHNLKLIGRMARIIGHEVRNPLTNIVLATEEMRQDLTENEDALLMLDMIQRNSNRISDLIDNFLKNTRSSEIKKESIEINKVVQEAIDNCHDRIILYKIDLKTTGLDCDLFVHLDRVKIVIALTNILINAVEVLEKIEYPKLEIALYCKNEEIHIEIRDNGPGMTEEIRKNLFNPFYSSKQGGLGLGMTSTKNIVSMHQGTIELETEPNVGTTFTVKLPL